MICIQMVTVQIRLRPLGFYERKSMTEEEKNKIDEIVANYERLVSVQTKQRDYLINYIARLVLPVQFNAIMKRLEEIIDE